MEKVGLQHIRAFSLKELRDITNDFSKEREIGSGGSGVVYMGELDNGEMIVVKKLHNYYDSCGKKRGNGEAEFLSELMNLFGLQHPNIIQLVGYCSETHNIVIECDGKRVLAFEEERALCLEYMHGGSLKNHISDESCGLEWRLRYNIIKGVCEGLKYLHTGSEKPIYHLDLKPDNILLDRNMIPKICDFGISRLHVGSMQTYSTESAISGTRGYMAPEYMTQNKISQKCDVYSLGVIMICVIAGDEGYQNYDSKRPSEEFIERVHENWAKRHTATMSSYSSQQLKSCTRIALRCVEFDRENRPTITEIVDEMNKIHAAKSSAIGGQSSEEEEHTTLEKQPDIQEQNIKRTEHLDENMKEKVNERSVVSSLQTRRTGSHEQDIQGHVLYLGSREHDIQDHVLHLQSGVQRLKDTLPAMYILIDEAEWRNHETCVAELLPNLMDAVYYADDLLDELRWYEMKVKLDGDESKSPFTYFFDSVIQGSFNKITDVQGRLEDLSSKLEKVVPRNVPRRFDKLVRPAASPRPYEKIFGRDNELNQVMGFLIVPKNSKRKRGRSSGNGSASTTTRNQVSNDLRTQRIPVLPIFGIGGVGKTTLAQLVYGHKQVKSHFDMKIWICVSDDFDEIRLIKEVLSCFGKEATTNNLDTLQGAISNHVNKKRVLIILDDMWDDALREHGQCWKKFWGPLGSSQEGSMMLITTRSEKVAKGVGTMEPFELKGFQDDVFWNFFSICVFGSDNENNNPELEKIGKKILPKLKGSPLAAKTLGHLLRMDLQALHWNSILESELWKLPQEVTDILPALRLSYMYLPFYLKRCFSFCAVYPKDFKFLKEDLAEIWVAEGFVDPQGDDSLAKIGCQYFEELVTRSFFQKVSGGYVIHDLLHDMAQKVSEHDCFILRNKDDFDKVPLNVRHIYVHPSSDLDNANLSSLCKHVKLRTLICKKQSGNKTSSVMKNWCTELLRIRVMSCASTNELPDSIGNLKHLRYLKISKGRPLSIPPTFCGLFNLQILDVRTCLIESLPGDFSNLRHLQRLESQGFLYYPAAMSRIVAAEQVQGVRLMKNLNQFHGHLEISNVDMISNDDALEAVLKSKRYLYKLTLKWSDLSNHQIMQRNVVEVLRVLQPPMSLGSLVLVNYPGVTLPSWFQPQMINLNNIPPVINDRIGILVSLTDLHISWCENLSSLEHFLHPEHVPVIKKICLLKCKGLVSVPTERFGDLKFLEEFSVDGCPNIRSQSLVSPFLKQLSLGDCGTLVLGNIDCRSLKSFTIESKSVTSIQVQMWSLPALEMLKFSYCWYLEFIGVSTRSPLCAGTDNIRSFSKLISLEIENCSELAIVDGLLTQEYLPVIERIHVQSCHSLQSLSGERFGSFASLKHLNFRFCETLNWQSGFVLPSSLQTLEFNVCGDISVCVPGCLENLTSLVSLKIRGCAGLTSIPGTIWRKLPLLEELRINNCRDLVSIGGAQAVAKIKRVFIDHCPSLVERRSLRRKQ